MVFQNLVLEIGEDNHLEFLENDLAVLHFFSDEHMPCLMTLPIIQSLAEEYCDKVCFGNINIEECKHLVEVYEVKKLPTLIILKNGKQIGRVDNSISEEVLRERICCLF